jgi:hypothetical protein
MNSTLLQNPSGFDIRASDFLRVHLCGVADSPRMDTNSTNHNHRWTSRSPRFKDVQSNSKVFKDKFEHTTTITRPTSLFPRDSAGPPSGVLLTKEGGEGERDILQPVSPHSQKFMKFCLNAFV